MFSTIAKAGIFELGMAPKEKFIAEFKQKLFHEHYCSEGHQGIENWSVTLIDQVADIDSPRKNKLYWINRLNTWTPNDLM